MLRWRPLLRPSNRLSGALSPAADTHAIFFSTTKGGQRRILKNKGTVVEYIRQAVQSGVYRTNEELDRVWKERSESGSGSGDSLQHIMRRFRQNIVRGSSIHDYPDEYKVLMQHPPLPDPARISKKEWKAIRHADLLRQHQVRKQQRLGKDVQSPILGENRQQQLRHLVQDELRRQERHNEEEEGVSISEDVQEYYERLFHIRRPSQPHVLAKKSAALQRAYSNAVLRYAEQRTRGTDRDVDDSLQEQQRRETEHSGQRTRGFEQWRVDMLREQEEKLAAKKEAERRQLEGGQEEASPPPTPPQHQLQPLSLTQRDKDDHREPEEQHESAEETLVGLLHNSPSVTYGMMRWSERFEAVPYQEWTVGASTALDHWIATRVLGLREETWLAVLQGEELLETGGSSTDALSIGRNVVAVRQAMFPETMLDAEQEGVEGDYDSDEEDSGSLDDLMAQLEGPSSFKSDSSIDELMASMAGETSSRSDTSTDDLTANLKGQRSSAPSSLSYEDDNDKLDQEVDKLMDEVQEWRRLNGQIPYEEWTKDDKDRFQAWMRNYVNTLMPSAGGKVDYDMTREAILSQPPVSREESNEFWDSLQNEGDAHKLLDIMRRDGAPKGATILQSSFWDMSYDDQLQRLLNLGTLRPLLDEYMSESKRLTFLQRHADDLLAGVELEHLVPDPNGPIRLEDLDTMTAQSLLGKSEYAIMNDPSRRNEIRFRLEVRPYRSTDDMSASERTRSLFKAWNAYKAGRAMYEEKLFQTGRLGLRYSDPIPNEIEEKLDSDEEDSSNDDGKTT